MPRIFNFPRTILFLLICSLLLPAPMAIAGSPDDYESLAEQVVIRRTDYGVPHILAENEKAAAFGFAWVQAEDHLPILYKAFIRGRAEMAKHFGEDELEFDMLVKLFRARERAIANYHRQDPGYRAMLEGFAAGTNYYLQQHPEEREPWMEGDVTPYDVAAAGQIAVMRFAFNRGGIIQRFRASKQNQAAMLEPYDREAMGSNTWAFDPSRTKSGNAILMNNPHQPWSEQANYYEAHITVPGKYNFYGSTFVGGPILTTGFNAHLGWAHTVNYPDLEEIYELTLDPENAGHFLFDGGSAPMWSYEHKIEVKGGDPVTRTHWYTHLGPVIHKESDNIYVLRSAGYDQFRAGEQWYAMGRSKNLQDFRDAMDMQSIAMFNTAYADREGNIYYLWNGTVPEMPHEPHLYEAQPAGNSSEIWTEIHPVSDLPQLLNPEGGYVQNCNDSPWYTSLKAPLDPANYPPYFSRPRLGLRSQHSLKLINNSDKYSLEDVNQMKFSMRMLLADRVKPDLIKAVEASEPAGDVKQAVEILRQWDNSVARDSVGGVLLKVWWDIYDKDNSNQFATPWTADAPMTTPRGLGDAERAAADFETAVAEVKKRFGKLDISWGEAHRLRRGDIDVPIGGGDGTIGCFRVIKYRDAEDGKWVAYSGDSYIFTAEFTKQGPVAYSVLAYSESGDPASPHHTDQSVLFANNELKPVRFTETDIMRNLEKKYRPGGKGM
jgi:acyl-homoserine-lactone acylase